VPPVVVWVSSFSCYSLTWLHMLLPPPIQMLIRTYAIMLCDLYLHNISGGNLLI
jgi:hypothetical protein